MANQNFRVKHGLEVNGNTLVTGITTIGSLDTAVADIISLSGTNISISGIASLPTLDTTFGEINYLSGVNLEYSGIASVTKLEATNAFVGVAATITTIDVTDGTIDVLSGTNINISGIATATTFSGNLTGNVTGNADTSTKLFTSRDFSISGDVATASAVSFDGSGNVDLAVSLSNNFNANTSGIITATQFHTGAEGSAIIVTSNTISGPSTITIDPSGVGDNTGLVVIKGDLQIDGTQTIVNSTVVTVDDKNLLLGSGALNDAAADGGGITLESADGNKTFNWIDSTDSWTSSENLDLASGKVYNINGVEVLSATKLTTTNVSASGIITATTFSGNLIGNVTGNVTGNLVGIASQAATLFTSRDFSLTGDVATVASGSFDGSSNLNLVTKLSNSFSANTTGIITATRFNSTQLNVTGLATINQLHLSGLTPDGSTYGIINYVPVADGNGTWSWQPIAAAGGGSLDGITLLEEGTAVGAAGSIISVNLIGNNITATAAGSSATITLNDNPSFGYVNLSGIITASSFVKSSGTSSQFLKADGSVDSSTYLTSYTETQTLDDVLTLGNVSGIGISVGVATASSFVKSGGTSSQFLKADGSVDSNTYLTAESQTLDGILTLGNTSALGMSVGVVTATSFVKSGGTSSQFLKADGTVDSSTYLTSYTETQTLDDVLTLGNTSSTGIQVGISTINNQLSITSSDGSEGRLDLYCEVNNAHYTRLQAAPHSTYSGNAIVTVPNTSGTLLLTDGDGSLLTGIVTSISGDSGITVDESTGNVTISGPDLSSYLTSYTETQTLDDVTSLGNITTNGISVGVLTATSLMVSGSIFNGDTFYQEDSSNNVGAYSFGPSLDALLIQANSLDHPNVKIKSVTGDIVLEPSSTEINSGIVTTTSNLTVAGDINFTGTLYQNGVAFSGGSSTFLGLSDTPGSFTASKFLAVNSGGTALEFVDAPSGGSTTFLALTDTPGSFTASKFLAINSAGDAIEFVDAPSGGGGISLTDLSITTAGTASGGGSLAYDNTTGVFTFTPAESGGGGGSSTFLGLSDTPGSFTASKFLAINSAGDAIEFVDAPSGGGGSTTFLALTDTPSSFGTAGQVLAVNSGGDGLEFVTASSGGGGGGISVGTRTGAVDNEDLVTGVTELRFAKAPFTVSDLGDGKVLLLTESSFNPIQVNGAAGVTASGEETLNLVAGDGITIVADNTSSPKKLTFTATGGGGGGGGASTLGDLTDVDLTTITPTPGKVLKYNGTVWAPATDSTGSGGGGGGGDGSAPMGENTRGTYDGGLVATTVESQINDIIDGLNLVMTKLAPPQPPPLNSALVTFALPTTGSSAAYTAYVSGTNELRTNSVVAVSQPETANTSAFFDGNNGTLTFEVDGSVDGSKTLTTDNDSGTYGGLTIVSDTDPFANATTGADFWYQLVTKAKATTPLAAGIEHTYQLKHTNTGNSQLLTFFVDEPGSPSVSNLTVNTSTATTRFISGVPGYESGSSFLISGTVNGAITKCYNSSKIADVSASQLTTANIPPSESGYSEGDDAPFTDVSVSFKNSSFSDGDITATVKGYNSKGTAGTSATVSVPGRIDTKSNESSRKTSGTGQYPTSGYGDSYDSTQSLLENEELQLLNNEYVYPSTDYSTNALAGPNYSTITGYRYVTYSLPSIGVPFPVQGLTITIAGSGLNADPNATKTIKDVRVYLKVDGSSPTTGWIDINTPHDGVITPDANGDASMVFGGSTLLSKKVTFGTVGRVGNVFVRIGFPAGYTGKITNVTSSA